MTIDFKYPNGEGKCQLILLLSSHRVGELGTEQFSNTLSHSFHLGDAFLVNCIFQNEILHKSMQILCRSSVVL